jgi:hypothetical protein
MQTGLSFCSLTWLGIGMGLKTTKTNIKMNTKWLSLKTHLLHSLIATRVSKIPVEGLFMLFVSSNKNKKFTINDSIMAVLSLLMVIRCLMQAVNGDKGILQSE